MTSPCPIYSAETLSAGMSFSSSIVHLGGVRILLPFHHTIASLILSAPVPFMMVGWGTIMSLMCLVNSYQNLLMYAIRAIHLYFYSV